MTHVVIAETLRQLRYGYDELYDEVRSKRAMLVTSPHGLRGIRPSRITVFGTPRRMTWLELQREIAQLKTKCPDMIVEYR